MGETPFVYRIVNKCGMVVRDDAGTPKNKRAVSGLLRARQAVIHYDTREPHFAPHRIQRLPKAKYWEEVT